MANSPTLADLRREIDRIDEAMHRLLMERGDIGLVPAAGGSTAWWTALEGGDAPKIIARLPFVERADHPASLPVFGVARPNPDAIVADVETWSVRVSGWGPTVARSLDSST